MVLVWNDQVDVGLVEETVMVDDDGRGSVAGSADWRPGTRAQITHSFRNCVDSLWSTLDHLVTETVTSLSAQHRVRDPGRRRFFPIADSWTSFAHFLEESALDGVLQPHFAIVRDCQPFHEPGQDDSLEAIRLGIRRLLSWSHALDQGHLVGAWATPVDPEVVVTIPATVRGVQAADPGPIDPLRDFATFELNNYSPAVKVSARSGTYVDLHFGAAPCSNDANERFVSQLEASIEAVAKIAAAFAWHIDQVGGSRRVSHHETAQNRAPWVPAETSTRYWSEADLTQLKESELGLGVVTDADDLTFVVSTPEGVFERTIPRATPLNRFVRPGEAAETAARDAAATWGLPDFILRPRVERKGAGVREISDGLVVVGHRGVIVQSKAREVAVGLPAREEAWINKQVKKAISQIDGTARRLQAAPSYFENGRGHLVPIDGRELDWMGVVLIEHPDPPPNFRCAPVDARVPFVTMLRRDWEFLFDQLRSTAAVIDYLFRVGEPAETLDGEPVRYFELARADNHATAPPTVDVTSIGVARRMSVPRLPTAPAGIEDEDGFGLFRMILEDIANIKIEPERIPERQHLLASLDNVPVLHRSELGRLLLTELATPADGGIRWKSRIFFATSDTDQVGFAVCSELNDTTKNGFQAWALLRHHDWGERVGGFNGLRSIFVLLTPDTEGVREWDTTLFAVTADPQLTNEQLISWRKFWGPTATAG